MQKKHEPIRKCSGCGLKKSKTQLIRIVKSADKKDLSGNIIDSGEIFLDLTGKKSGRGAYICKDLKCFNLARKAKRFERAFSCKIPDEVYNQLEVEIKRNE